MGPQTKEVSEIKNKETRKTKKWNFKKYMVLKNYFLINYKSWWKSKINEGKIWQHTRKPPEITIYKKNNFCQNKEIFQNLLVH